MGFFVAKWPTFMKKDVIWGIKWWGAFIVVIE